MTSWRNRSLALATRKTTMGGSWAARIMRGGPPQQVQVVVENRGANQVEVVEQRAEADGGRLVVNVAMDDIARRGPLSQALEQTYGLTRRTG